MKPTVIKAAAFGAGFALIAGAIVAGVYWWVTRRDSDARWNSTALRATLSDIDVWQDVGTAGTPSEEGSLEFTYVVHNQSGRDYSTTGASVVIMARRPDGLAASEKAIVVGYPIFIPSGERVAVKISIPYGRALGPIEANTDVRRRVREKLPKLAGFVLFDRATRYQIDFPSP